MTFDDAIFPHLVEKRRLKSEFLVSEGNVST